MKKEYEIMRELKRLKTVRGSGTELITIYVPTGFSIAEEISKLRTEYGQASNIKSKTTRLNVQGAIEKLIQYLKLYREPPKNGMAVFCGNISSSQANPDIELFSMEPPHPIKVNIYRCDSTFLLEPIEGMLEAKEAYVLLVMDGREATIATLRGTHVTQEKRVRSFAHAKVRKGGQSAARYERAISESIDDYYKEVGDSINKVYEKYGNRLNGLIVGGPGPAKENFVRAKTLDYRVKVMGIFDTGYTDETMGINELLERSKEVLTEQAVVQERKIMERFLGEVARSGLVASGYESVKAALDEGNVSRLLVSDAAEYSNVRYKCSACGTELSAIEKGAARRDKHECGGKLDQIGVKDAVDELIEEADRQGIETVFVSAESQYGKEFHEGFGGIGAMLRHR